MNLAVTLHNQETQVVLVDGNLQFGDVAVFLNEQGKYSVLDLAPRAEELDPEVVQEVLLTHSPSGMKVLASPARPEQAEQVTGEQFGKVLAYLATLFPYVIVDTTASLTDITLAAIDASDLTVLITTQEIPAIKNARLFFDLVDVLKIRRESILFVMNRFDRRIGITPEKIGESFKHEIAAVVPFDDHIVVPSINRGVPFMMGDRTKPLAKSILGLSEAVRQQVTGGSKAEAAPEPVARLFGKR